MSKTSMEITMSEDLKQRLHTPAAATGKTVQEFAQEALYTYVEEMEDGAPSYVGLAEEGPVYSYPQGEKAVGLDHSVREASRKTA